MFSDCPPSGGGRGTPSPSHNTPTGPMSFWGGTPSPSHNTSTGPMYFLGVPQWLVPGPGPFLGVPQFQLGLPQSQMWGYPICLDRLCHRRYASYGFRQEDFLVIKAKNSDAAQSPGNSCTANNISFSHHMGVLLSYSLNLIQIIKALSHVRHNKTPKMPVQLIGGLWSII